MRFSVGDLLLLACGEFVAFAGAGCTAPDAVRPPGAAALSAYSARFGNEAGPRAADERRDPAAPPAAGARLVLNAGTGEYTHMVVPEGAGGWAMHRLTRAVPLTDDAAAGWWRTARVFVGDPTDAELAEDAAAAERVMNYTALQAVLEKGREAWQAQAHRI